MEKRGRKRKFRNPPKLLRKFLKHLGRRSKDTTQHYRLTLGHFNVHLKVKGKRLEQMHLEDVEDFLDEVAGRNVSSLTIKRESTRIRKFAEWLWRRDILEEREWRGIEAYTKDLDEIESEDNREALSDEDIQTILRKVLYPLYAIIFWIAYQFGLRPMEICNLKVSHIDWEHMVLKIVRSKGGRSRKIPILKHQEAPLKKWLKYRETDKPRHEYVFHDFNGKPLSRGAASRIFMKISKISRVYVYCYRCRYTFAVNLWRRGVDIFVISKKLGHKNVATTMRYLKVHERMVDHAYRETLERGPLLNPNTTRIDANLALYNSMNLASRF